MKVLKTLPRLYVNNLNPSIEFYEELLGTAAAMRFEIPQIGLELAQVGDILLIAGSDEALKPFRSTQATMLVDSLDEFKTYLEEKGAEIIRGPNTVPTRQEHDGKASGWIDNRIRRTLKSRLRINVNKKLQGSCFKVNILTFFIRAGNVLNLEINRFIYNKSYKSNWIISKLYFH